MSVAAALSASAVAVLLALVPVGRMPQVVRGDGALAVAFGDARETISHALVHKADSYFHGGIDMECKHLEEHGGHEDRHGRQDHVEETHGIFDPWRWINSHVRAPERHIHLDGGKSVELLPWFWAAVRADPHNVDAWTTAWYVAAHVMKDDLLALRIAEDGWRRNPGSIEIACALGRTYRAKNTFDRGKSKAMFEEAVRLGRAKGRLSEREELSFHLAESHLAEYAAGRP